MVSHLAELLFISDDLPVAGAHDDGQFPANGGRFFWFGQAFFYPDPDFFIGAWSLAIEEWFYLLFPLTLFFFVRLLTKREAALLCTIVVFLVVPVIFRAILPVTFNWDAGVRRITLPRLDAIAYGVVLAFAKNYYANAWKFLAKLWPLGIAAMIGIFVQFCYHVISRGYFTSDSFFDRVFYFCVFSLSLMLAFPKIAELAEPVEWWKVPIQKLSLWSYSVYLCHPVVIGLVDAADERLGISYIHAHVDKFVFTWLICIPLSALLYKFYEKPLMNLRDQPLKLLFWRPQRTVGTEEKT
jgi:peptidoglycan/LPS O-acetylase OafA/YrhL